MAKGHATQFSAAEALSRSFDSDTNTIAFTSYPSKGTATHTAVSVTSSNSTLLAANTNRNFLMMVNDSDTDVYVTIEGTSAAVNTGIRLNANGGSIMFDVYCPTAAIKGIHGSSGNKTLLITEA